MNREQHDQQGDRKHEQTSGTGRRDPGWWRRAAIGLVAALLGASGAACSSDQPPMGQDGGDGSGSGKPPTLGAHALVFQRLYGGLSSVSTPALATSSSGSTILVSVGRGDFDAFTLPTDNKGNAPYRQLGESHTYTRWRDSGTALYAFPDAKGGAGHVVTSVTPTDDEITMSAVEVKGTRVQDFQWREVQAGDPITSPKVTTTGPATLVAFWWGDAGVDNDKTATPDSGFQVIDSVLASGALVQSSVAVKHVTEAGTYDVTWTATPLQGAQLWIAAVQ